MELFYENWINNKQSAIKVEGDFSSEIFAKFIRLHFVFYLRYEGVISDNGLQQITSIRKSFSVSVFLRRYDWNTTLPVPGLCISFSCNSSEYAAVFFVFGITWPYLLCCIDLLEFSKKYCKALRFNHVFFIFILHGNCNESAKAKSCLENCHWLFLQTYVGTAF